MSEESQKEGSPDAEEGEVTIHHLPTGFWLMQLGGRSATYEGRKFRERVWLEEPLVISASNACDVEMDMSSGRGKAPSTQRTYTR